MLTCQSLSKRFGGVQALKDVDLSVKRNEIAGIVGPNGSGKSTLLNLISGVYAPDSGRIYFMDEEITKLPSFKICAKGISKTSQIVQSFPNMTTLQNVLVSSLFSKARGDDDWGESLERSKNLLEFTGVEESKYHTLVRNLNLAELRRVQLAKALATGPKLLLLDELLTGLNPKETDEAIGLIKRVNSQGITILMVEHVMRIIMSLCDRLTVLHHGEKISEGSPKSVVQDDAVVKIYLGKKYQFFGE